MVEDKKEQSSFVFPHRIKKKKRLQSKKSVKNETIKKKTKTTQRYKNLAKYLKKNFFNYFFVLLLAEH